MNTLQTVLLQAFSTNFVLYYQTHAAHVNITGRLFVSDHDFLGEIYQDLQSNIDTYAEHLRQLECYMPETLQETLQESILSDTMYVNEHVFELLYNRLEQFIDHLRLVYREAERQSEFGLANYIADRLATHKKTCWKLRSILEEREEPDYE